MKLKRLKLLCAFRSLPAGFEIEFRKTEASTAAIEPLCMVGLNGSGKSNVLQAISEIFYYLESFCIANKEQRQKLKSPLGFEIEYRLGYYQTKESRVDDIINEALSIQEDPPPGTGIATAGFVCFSKEPFALPIFLIIPYVFTDESYGLPVAIPDKTDQPDDSYSVDYRLVMPRRVIGYSSGMNELISNAFIKMDFHYFDEFQKRTTGEDYSGLDVNRLFFMDYDSNKMIVLANFLFAEQSEENKQKLQVLTDALGILQLDKFSITMRFKNVYDQAITLPSQLLVTLNKLKQCATCWQDNDLELGNNEKQKRVIRLDFKIEAAVKKAFQYHFRSATELYKSLYLLRVLNIHLNEKSLRTRIKNSVLDDNLSALLPKPAQNKLLFAIDDIAFKKKDATVSIYYRELSDGEHQLLHVLGTIMLMDLPGTLFIMDEPETHFNPEWRSKFVNILNKLVGIQNEIREQEIVLTSHSPFIVSDCQSEHVFIFERDPQTRLIKKPENPDFNTFGASVNLITAKVFRKRETISGMANDRLTKLKEDVITKAKSKEQAVAEIDELGD